MPMLSNPSPSSDALPPSRRERRSADIRERLFRSALLLFAQKGFAETTVEDITEAADVGKGTFFNYFPSKDHILLAFSDMQLAKLEQSIHGLAASQQPLREFMRGLVLLPSTIEPTGRAKVIWGSVRAHFPPSKCSAGKIFPIIANTPTAFCRISRRSDRKKI